MSAKTYPLSIDPRILELLGPSLYTNIYYVLAELIANAYDAMAHNVYIIENENDITVEDDGKGMSYANGDVKHFLSVAKESRISDADSFTDDGKRRRMGRKGIGKLAALSVSENVIVKTRQGDEVSGFILSRHVGDDGLLIPIQDEEIGFQEIHGNGTAIVMQDPQYRLHKTNAAVKRNMLNIFPAVGEDFKLHFIRKSSRFTIASVDLAYLKDLCAIVAYGDAFKPLCELVMNGSPWRDRLVFAKESLGEPIKLKNKDGVLKDYLFEIKGWIGAYKTTTNRKAEISDFPDNFISLYANKKMGEFNVLPLVGQNKMNESYVVGQLHIDIFELTELPDMALSNRQGYKSDDPRYQLALKKIRDTILPEALKLRSVYAKLRKAEKDKQRDDALRANEVKLKDAVEAFKRSAAKKLVDALGGMTGQTVEVVEKKAEEVVNDSLPELGIKARVDSGKRRILISQTKDDKPIADIVYKMLLHNNVPARDVIYTNCDDDAAWIPEGETVYGYLREFFVESYSTQKIYVLFITSVNTKQSWGSMMEIGAGWITQIDNKVFRIGGFRPEHPLDDERLWHSTNRNGDKGADIWMDNQNAILFCRKIEDVCDKLGYQKQSREDNLRYLNRLVAVRDE